MNTKTYDDWLGHKERIALVWTLNSDDALNFFDFEPGKFKWPDQGYYWKKVRYLIGAFRALYGELLLTESAHTLELRENVEAGSISADALVSLPPEVEAFRDYALDVVKDWCHRPRSYSEVASMLTRRGVPTPDGKTMWRHNQIERLIATAEDQELKQRVRSQTTATYDSLEQMDQLETAD